MIKKLLVITFLFVPTLSVALDRYEPSTGNLHIPNVKAGENSYVVDMLHQGDLAFKLTTANLTSGSSSQMDTYNAETGILNIPHVCVGADDYVVTMQFQGDWFFKVTSAISNVPSLCGFSNPPIINEFTVENVTSVPVIKVSIKGTDDNGITGWLISETPAIPNIEDTNWHSEPPSYYSIFSPGKVTLHAWAKDATGNLSQAATQVVDYTLPTQYGDYTPDKFLNSPQKAINFIALSADFWKASKDEANGGFFTFVDKRGKVLDSRDKTFLTQSRNAYGFARAFMVTGDESYLENARHALGFLYDHGWDHNNDGWYYMANEFGNIFAGQGWTWDYSTKTKWAFQQHYALVGIAALYEASRNETDYNWLLRGYDSNETHLWDSDPIHYGYFTSAFKDWSSPTGKGFTPTVDAVTTNVLPLYLLTQDEKYLKRLKQLGDNMINYLEASTNDPLVKVGMIEHYTTDWKYDRSNGQWDVSDPGRIMKTGWSLGRIFQLTKEEKYRASARNFMQRAWTDGTYDHTNGGTYSQYNASLGTITDSDKTYWILEQGFTGGLTNWFIDDQINTKNDALEMARGSIDFFMQNLPDKVDGEVFPKVNSDGSIITDDAKSGLFKAGYHGIELGYHAYLYGSLYYQNQPVSLYYKIEKKQEPRSIKLWPVAIEDSKLIISEVKLDGILYSDYQRSARILNIPVGVGGKFQITFQRIE